MTLERFADKLAGAKDQGINETTMRRLDVAREMFDKSRRLTPRATQTWRRWIIRATGAKSQTLTGPFRR